MVMTSALGRRGMVLLPEIRVVAEGAREYLAPEIVRAELPGRSVWLPMRYAEAVFAVQTAPSIVTIPALEPRGMTLLSVVKANADGASEYLVPSMVIVPPLG